MMDEDLATVWDPNRRGLGQVGLAAAFGVAQPACLRLLDEQFNPRLHPHVGLKPVSLNWRLRVRFPKVSQC